MRMFSPLHRAAALAVAAFLLAPSVSSAAFVYTLDHQNGDVGPGAVGPFGKVFVELDATKTIATVTLQALNDSSGNHYMFTDGGLLGLNVNSSSFTGTVSSWVQPNPLGIIHAITQADWGYTGPGNEDGFGSFNFQITSGDASHSVSEVVVTLTNNSGPWQGESSVLIGNGHDITSNLPNGHVVGAHVKIYNGNYTQDNSNTGYATDSSGGKDGPGPHGPLGTPVPGGVVLFGLGGLMLGATARLRKRLHI